MGEESVIISGKCCTVPAQGLPEVGTGFFNAHEIAAKHAANK